MNLRATLLVFTLTGLAGVLAYFWAAGQRAESVEPLRLTADPTCDLRRTACRLALDDGRVLSLDIEPKQIPLMQRLRLDVGVDGSTPEAITVEIVGLNMDMGLNRTRLALVSPGHWSGETILPICSRARMDWEAQVRVSDPGGVPERIAPFRFHTRR